MAKLLSLLLLFVSYALTIGCERSSKNVETAPCDPKKAKCVSGTSSNTSGGGSDDSWYNPDSSPYVPPTDSPYPSFDPYSPGPQTPVIPPNLTGGGDTPPTPDTSGGGGDTPPGGGGGGDTPPDTSGGGGGGGGDTPPDTSGGGGDNPPPKPDTTGGGNPPVGPQPVQTIDPSFVPKQLNVTTMLDSSGNLKLFIPPQSAQPQGQSTGLRYSNMRYSISAGEIPSASQTSKPDSNGFYDAGPLQLNLMLFFKYDGADCQSETNVTQGATSQSPVATRCHP